MPEDDRNQVWVVVDSDEVEAPALTPHEGDEFEAQAGPFKAWFRREPKEFDFEQVQGEWRQRLEQVDALAKVADAKTDAGNGLRLTEIELGLTITAEGHLAFIASASASATLTVKFAR